MISLAPSSPANPGIKSALPNGIIRPRDWLQYVRATDKNTPHSEDENLDPPSYSDSVDNINISNKKIVNLKSDVPDTGACRVLYTGKTAKHIESFKVSHGKEKEGDPDPTHGGGCEKRDAEVGVEEGEGDGREGGVVGEVGGESVSSETEKGNVTTDIQQLIVTHHPHDIENNNTNNNNKNSSSSSSSSANGNAQSSLWASHSSPHCPFCERTVRVELN